MPQGSLSTAESVIPLLDVVSIRFVNTGFHMVCSECKKENPFESYMAFFLFCFSKQYPSVQVVYVIFGVNKTHKCVSVTCM